MRKGHAREIGGVMAIRAILVSGIGRYVITELAQRNYIVVAGVAAVDDTRVIIGSGCKGAGRVTNAAVIDGWHMSGVHAYCRTRPVGNMTGEAAIAHDTGMIESRTGEIVGVMADTTILGGSGVRRYR